MLVLFLYCFDYFIYKGYEVVTSLTTLRCPKLSIKNANVRYAKRNSASARIRCHSTHSLVGNNIIYCYHGRWDGDVPICVTKSKCAFKFYFIFQ